MTSIQFYHIDTETYGPLASINSGPIPVFESQFKIKIPKEMEAEFTQAVQAIAEDSKTEQTREDIWKAFKNAYICPKDSTVFYATHKIHKFGDGSCFVSVDVIEDDKLQTKSGNGITLTEAVVDAFTIAGHKVTRKRGMIDAPGYGHKACAIIGVTEGDGKTYFGVGISEQHRTAEIMAATRACGRMIHAKGNTPHI